MAASTASFQDSRFPRTVFLGVGLDNRVFHSMRASRYHESSRPENGGERE